MEDKYSLEGKLVTIFLRGSWEFTGRVEFASKDKIVLLSEMGSLVVYKENIVAAMIIDERKRKDTIEAENPPQYDIDTMPRNTRAPPRILLDQDQLDHYGSVIPEDMLQGDPDEVPVSFSMSMQDLKSIKEKKDGSTEKAPVNRGKDKKGV